MDLSIPFLLLVQGINTLLNWSLVLLVHQSHLGLTSSFMGTFCASLTLVDTLFTVVELTIYRLQDFSLFGVRFTTQHICLLVQIAGFVYSTLQWPVLFAAGLDHYGSFPVGSKQTCRNLKLNYAACAVVLWAVALLYVFLGSGCHPVVEDSPHLLLDHCLTQRNWTSSHISFALLMTVACIRLYARMMVSKDKPKEEANRHPVQKSQNCDHSRLHILDQALITFTRTWAAFLILMVVILVWQIDVPSHLMMNVPWLSFLNSFLISVSLCTHYQKLNAYKILTFTDGICQWNFAFTDG
ncbi:putative G-protein coupled receptor 160 [Alosa pseudoharengus]|uniref:putative G-protein coupled receptor 160 n=1 Tax=Alosa pseudoharengus TaxID=34774 RepID=UPI003F8A70C5